MHPVLCYKGARLSPFFRFTPLLREERTWWWWGWPSLKDYLQVMTLCVSASCVCSRPACTVLCWFKTTSVMWHNALSHKPHPQSPSLDHHCCAWPIKLMCCIGARRWFPHPPKNLGWPRLYSQVFLINIFGARANPLFLLQWTREMVVVLCALGVWTAEVKCTIVCEGCGWW